MSLFDIQAALIEEGKPRKNHKWKLYAIDALFKVDGEAIEKNWTVEAKNYFAADRWANIVIESEAGTLKGAKKQIIKVII